MKKLILFLLICMSVFELHAQDPINRKIDSLQTALQSASEQNKPELLNRLADVYLDISSADSRKFALEALEISQNIGNYKEEANAYINLGTAKFNNGLLDSVMYYYKLSLKVYQTNKDNNGIAESYNRIALVYERLEEYDLAVSQMIEALKIHEKSKNLRGQAQVLNNIGIIYNTLGETEKSLQYYWQALELFRKTKNNQEAANVLNNIGTSYFDILKFDSAIVMIKQALGIHQQIGDLKAVANEQSNLGILCMEKKNYIEAENYFKLALETNNKTEDMYGKASIFEEYGKMRYQLNQLDSAMTLLQKALELRKQLGNKKGQLNPLRYIAMVYEGKGKYYEALEYHKLFQNLREEVYSIEKEEFLAEITAKYENEKNVQKLIMLTKEIEVQEITQWFLILLAIVLLTISLFTYFALRLKSKLYQTSQKNLEQVERLNQLEIKTKEHENERLLAENKQKEIEAMMLEEDFKNQQKVNQLQKEKFDQEIEYKNKVLLTTTMHVVNKNKVLSDIKRMLASEIENSHSKNHQLQKIQNEITSNMNLDNDWDDFKLHFEAVNSNFFEKLQSKYPELTKHDLKLCAYIYMNLSTKEIAQILNITIPAVNKSRNRLRKKLNVDSETNLSKWMMEI